MKNRRFLKGFVAAALILSLPFFLELFLGWVIHTLPQVIRLPLPHSKLFSEDLLPQELILKQSRRNEPAAIILLGDCLIFGHGQKNVPDTLLSLKPFLPGQRPFYNLSELGAVPATMLSLVQQNADLWQNKTLVIGVAPIAFQHDYNEMYAHFKQQAHQRDRLNINNPTQSSLLHWWSFKPFFQLVLNFYERNFSDVNYMLLQNLGTASSHSVAPPALFNTEEEQKLNHWGWLFASQAHPQGWRDFWKMYRAQITATDWRIFYKLVLSHTYLFQLKQAWYFFYRPQKHVDYANNQIAAVNYPATQPLNEVSPALLFLDQIAKLAQKNKIKLYFTLHPAPWDSYSATQKEKWFTLKKNLGLILWAAGYSAKKNLHVPVFPNEAFENGYYLNSLFYKRYLQELAQFISAP